MEKENNTYEFLKLFFSGDNLLKWNDIQENKIDLNWLDYIKPWINSFSQKKINVLCLPLLVKNEDVIWYGFAFNEDDYSALKEELYSINKSSYILVL